MFQQSLRMSTDLLGLADVDQILLRRTAVAHGFTDRHLLDAVRRRQLARIRQGAYTPAAHWEALDREARARLLGRAVMRISDGRWVLSHQSAALEHGCPVWGLPLDKVHVTRTHYRTSRTEAGIVHHTATVMPGDVVERDGLEMTTPVRTLFEVCQVGSVEQGLVVADWMLHEGLVRPGEMALMHERAAAWPGLATAQLVKRLADGRVESVGESRTRFLCWQAGLPAPVPQYEVRTRLGDFRCDFAWPEHGLVVEFDGRGKYTSLLRDGDDPSIVVVREKRREDAIRETTGWIVLRLTWSDLAQPRRTAELIAAKLAEARSRTALAR